MARGWHYTKLSLTNALLSFSGMCFAFLLLFFCRFVLFSFCFVFMRSFVNVPLIFFLSSRPRNGLSTTCITTVLGMAEARQKNFF